MTDHLTLFNIAPSDADDCGYPHLKPLSGYRYGCRCSRCVSGHAAWKPNPICAYEGCTKLKRKVQGAKFCDEHATMLKGVPTGNGGVVGALCGICQSAIKAWASTPNPVCRDCSQRFAGLLRSARRHRVEWPKVVEWAHRSTCDLCDKRLYLGKAGGAGAGFAVDHDHSCCSSSRVTCGNCTRGLLCAACNTGLGSYERLLTHAGHDRLSRYLKGGGGSVFQR